MGVLTLSFVVLSRLVMLAWTVIESEFFLDSVV